MNITQNDLNENNKRIINVLQQIDSYLIIFYLFYIIIYIIRGKKYIYDIFYKPHDYATIINYGEKMCRFDNFKLGRKEQIGQKKVQNIDNFWQQKGADLTTTVWGAH